MCLHAYLVTGLTVLRALDNDMNKKASVEWRLIWIILIIITALAAIALIVFLFYASSHSTSPFSYFGNLLGGGS